MLDRLPPPRVLWIEILSGLVVALALIPEAISFALIAGVDPRVGLYASVTMAITIAIAGGRPAMISAATGAMALVVVSLVRDHGLEYLLAATLLAGAIQIVFGVLGVARAMRFIPRSVMTGFINSLAILIFIAQMPYLRDVPWEVYGLVAAGLFVLWVLPKLTKVVPAPLVAIVLISLVVVSFGIDVPTVGDEGELPDSLPPLGIPNVPWTWDMLLIIAPYSLTLAAVGLLESLLTAQLVDDVTDTVSDKDREARGQGIANIVTGAFGGMAGCAMIGQTMINVGNGARTRVSTFAAGGLLLVLMLALGDIVGGIPMAALVAVMIMVSALTFDWHSVAPRTLRLMPRSETMIMFITMGTTVATHNLALGVGAGVIAAMATFARRVAHLVDVTSTLSADGSVRTYVVSGELFFASDRELIAAFDYASDPPSVVIDLSPAHVWDASAVTALDTVATRYGKHGTTVEIVGLNAPSSDLHGALSGQLPGAR